MHGDGRRACTVLLMAVLLATVATPVTAHPGGLDAQGGHHCRQAGFDSGKCSPLNSYHYHRGGGGSDGSGSSSSSSGSGGSSAGAGSSGGGSSIGGSSGSSSGSSTPRPSADTTPPDRPDLGTAAVDGSSVQIPITAEQGSTVRFQVGGVTIHTMTADGAEQRATFTLNDGDHDVSVTATDAAGNTSRAAEFSVALDTTPPDAPAVLVDAGDAPGARTTIRVEGETGAEYEVSVEGPTRQAKTGKLSSGATTMPLRLPNGDYTVTSRLIDDNGNESTVTTREFVVALPAPDAPTVTVTSDPGADPLELSLDAPGATRVVVTLLDTGGGSVEKTVRLDPRGTGEATFALSDGDYDAEAVAIDFQDQTSDRTPLDGLVVKTTLPNLALGFVSNLLAAGIFGYELEAEEGATVRIASETSQLLGEFTATGLVQEFSFEVPNGEHVITVSVTDSFGNETVREFTAVVSTPFGLAEWAAVILLLAAVGAVGGGVWKYVTRVRRVSNVSPTPTYPPPPPPPAPRDLGRAGAQ